MAATCSVEDCDRPARTRGWCQRHYRRWQRHGDPNYPDTRNQAHPVEPRFRANVRKNRWHWVWVGGRSSAGYGYMSVNGRQTLAHRISWELHYGPIPEGIDVLHRCDRPWCVRPACLFLGTAKENGQDMMQKGRGRGQFQKGNYPARWLREGRRRPSRRSPDPS